jgi:hypothetical protein
MRVRPDIPEISGCFIRAYLSTSQNRFWQSINCNVVQRGFENQDLTA